MAVIEYVRYYIPPEQTQAFLAAWGKAYPLISSDPDCLDCELHQGIELPTEFIARVLWSSIDAHNIFRGSRIFPEFKANFSGIDIKSIGHYTKINH